MWIAQFLNKGASFSTSHPCLAACIQGIWKIFFSWKGKQTGNANTDRLEESSDDFKSLIYQHLQVFCSLLVQCQCHWNQQENIHWRHQKQNTAQVYEILRKPLHRRWAWQLSKLTHGKNMQYYTFLSFHTKGSLVSTDTFMIRKNISETKPPEEQSKMKNSASKY